MDMWSLWPLLMEALAEWAIDFFPSMFNLYFFSQLFCVFNSLYYTLFVDILVPLDNYISRSTVHYLTCKDPDYQQSLWVMLSNVRNIKTIFFIFLFYKIKNNDEVSVFVSGNE